MGNENKIKVRFADDLKSPTLEIGNGGYYRKFVAKDQPFECDKEEAAMLVRTGHFVEAPPEGGTPNAAKSEGQSAAAESVPRAVATGSVPPASAGGPKSPLGKIGGAPVGTGEEQSAKI